MKLKNDFGVRALCMVLIILGVFALSGVGLIKGTLDFKTFFVAASTWVIAIIAFYFPRK